MTISECVCVRCPQGCMIQVEMRKGESPIVRGNACARGADYAVAEVTRPARILTMTMPASGILEPLSVKTTGPIPKDMVPKVVCVISQHKVDAPIHLHDIVIPNICGLGVDVIATKSLPGADN